MKNTRADKEQDRICHVDACSAQTGPILMAYRKDERISRIVEREKRKTPVFAFASPDGVMHRGWRVSDGESICGIRTSFAEINQIYIADGHHRAASAVKVGLSGAAGIRSTTAVRNSIISFLFCFRMTN